LNWGERESCLWLTKRGRQRESGEPGKIMLLLAKNFKVVLEGKD